jgi:fructooligosaccharide transport system permease protein
MQKGYIEIEKEGETLPVINKHITPKKRAQQVIYVVFGVVLSLFFIFPIVYMLAASTKNPTSYAADAGTIAMFIPDFAHMDTFFSNYIKVLTEYGIWRNALNSFLYAAIVIVFNILVNGLAGYVMSKFDFPGKKFFSFIIIFLIVVPVETSIVPLYAIVKNLLGLKAELSVLAVIFPAIISIFNIFLFMQFFESIPKDYEEAARMDGASNLTIFFKIILPLSKPILATVAVFCFIGVWNDYLWPTMVLTDQDLYPIQAVLTTIQSKEGVTTGEIMASLVITSIPVFIVYVAAQKYIVQGFGSAGLKM